jgi:hypothetical protein
MGAEAFAVMRPTLNRDNRFDSRRLHLFSTIAKIVQKDKVVMDQDVQNILEKLEAKMRALKQARETLLEQFGDSGAGGTHHRRRPQKSGRREQVIKFLKEHGPTKSAEIMKQTKIPVGTLGFVLKDKTTFVRDEQGRWSPREKEDNG